MIDPGARRILVVDDEPANRRLTQAILSAEGYEIVHAESGEQALEIVAGGYVDLVLLDVMMPGIDGIEACRRIRELPIHRYLPVVLLTALADTDTRTRGKLAGADDFLTKPIHEDELVARTRNLVALVQYHELVEVQRLAAEREATLWKLVSGVADAVGACHDYVSLHAALESTLANDLPIDSSTVMLVDGDRLSVHATDPVAPTSFEIIRWSASRWVPALCRSNAYRIGPHDGDAAPFGMWLADRGYGDGVIIPVIAAGELRALLLLARHCPFDDADHALLQMLSPHLGNAVNHVRLQLQSEQLLLAREELAKLLVHDLKNPLSAARLNIEVARSGRLPADELAASLDDAATAAERVFTMLTDLLDIGAAEEGRLEIARGPCVLAEIVDEALHGLTTTLKARKIEVVLDLDRSIEGDVDRKLLRRVVENLLGNAIRFVPSRGKIEISIGQRDRGTVLRVSNDGPSVPAAVHAKLFGKYAGVRDGKGSARGLGLYFCRLVVEGHGGTITSVPRADGATFEVTLSPAPSRTMRAAS